jgi:hypothetical protein
MRSSITVSGTRTRTWPTGCRSIRAADRVALAAGHDLTQYTRSIRLLQDNFEVTYDLRGDVADGSFTVKVNARTGRAVEKIFWWDGTEDPLLPEAAGPSIPATGAELPPGGRS